MAVDKRTATNVALVGMLRGTGLKAMPSRLAVLRALKKARKPLSVRRLMRTLQAKHHMDQVTVYRTLNTLVDAGIIRRVDFRHGHAHFELCEGGDHHHIVCVRCDRVEDVRACAAEPTHKATVCAAERMHQRVRKETGFARVTDHALEFFGLCQRCDRVRA